MRAWYRKPAPPFNYNAAARQGLKRVPLTAPIDDAPAEAEAEGRGLGRVDRFRFKSRHAGPLEADSESAGHPQQASSAVCEWDGMGGGEERGLSGGSESAGRAG